MAQHFKLSSEQKPATDGERQEMSAMPYANIVSSIMYNMIYIRSDVAYAISITSRYMSEYGKEHWNALKWILRYLKGATSCGILFKSVDEGNCDAIIGYCDVDYATNVDSGRSQTRFVFTMYGTSISWKSNLRNVVALSTTETEYMALTAVVKESFWLKGLANDYDVKQLAVTIHCDNNSGISVAKDQVFHERSKHIDVRLQFIRDEIEKEKVRIVKISINDNPADMLTKALAKEKFEFCKRIIGLVHRF